MRNLRKKLVWLLVAAMVITGMPPYTMRAKAADYVDITGTISLINATASLGGEGSEVAIKLTEDIVLNGDFQGIEMKTGDDLTIDLNGHIINATAWTGSSSTVIYMEGGTLTIEDSVGTGKILTASKRVVELENYGEIYEAPVLYLKGGTLQSSEWAVITNDYAEVYISGGNIIALDNDAIFERSNGRTMIHISGGTISAPDGYSAIYSIECNGGSADAFDYFYGMLGLADADGKALTTDATVDVSYGGEEGTVYTIAPTGTALTLVDGTVLKFDLSEMKSFLEDNGESIPEAFVDNYPYVAVVNDKNPVPGITFPSDASEGLSFTNWIYTGSEDPIYLEAGDTTVDSAINNGSEVQATAIFVKNEIPEESIRWSTSMKVGLGDEAEYPLDEVLLISSDQASSAEFKVKDAADSTYTSTIPTTAGGYTVKYVEANYETLTVYNSFDFWIGEATNPGATGEDLTWTDVDPTVSQDTNGKDLTITNTGDCDLFMVSIEGDAVFKKAFSFSNDEYYEGDEITFTEEKTAYLGTIYPRAKLDPGTYEGKLEITLSDFYGTKVSFTVNVTAEVMDASLTRSEGTVALDGWYYGQSAKTPTATFTNPAGTSYTITKVEYKEKDAADSTYTTTAPSAIGDYTARITAKPADTDYASLVGTADFSITQIGMPTLPSGNYYNVSGTAGANRWYISDVEVTAPTGYRLSTSADGQTIVDKLTITASQDSSSIYLVYGDGTADGVTSGGADTDDAVTAAISLEAFKIDKTAPEITGAADGGSYTGSISVTVTDDNLASVTLNEKAQTFTGTTCTFDVAPEAEAVTIVATDAAGLSTTISFNVDPADASGTISLEGWYFGQTANSPSAELDVEESIEYGISETLYKVQGAADSTYTATVPSAVGDYTVKCTVSISSSEYNEFVGTADFSISYLPAPATAEGATPYTISGTEGTNGWYTTNVTVTAPAGYNIATSADGSDAAASITVTASQAAGSVYFVSTLKDATAGGITDAITLEAIKIDKTAPAISGAADGGSYTGSISVTVTDDNLASVTLNEKAQTFTGTTCTFDVAPAAEAVTIVATDDAGLSTTISINVNAEDATGTISMEGWYFGQTANTPSAELDVEESIEYGISETLYKVQGAADSTYTATVPSAVGDYTVKCTVSISSSEYNEFVGTANFSISYLPAPATAEGASPYTISGTAGTNGWYTTDVTVSAPAGYNIATSADGSDAAASITVTASQAAGSVYFVSILKDATAGGITDAITLEAIKIDKTAPAITGAADGGSYEGSISVTVTDDNLASVTVNEKAQTFTGTTCTFTVAPDTEDITIEATDDAGLSTTITFTVALKDSKATISMPDYYVGQALTKAILNSPVTIDGNTVTTTSIEYKKAGDPDTAYGTSAPDTAGTYTVRYTGTIAGGDYEPIDVTTDFTVSYLPTPAGLSPYPISGTAGKNGWYTTDVEITAPEGYTISTSADGKNKTDKITVSASQAATEIYLVSILKDASEGAVTDKIEIPAIKIDKTSPAVTGVEDGKAYSGESITFTVEDDNLVTVTLDGTDQTITGTTCTVTASASTTAHELVATDEAGLTTTITFTVSKKVITGTVTQADYYVGQSAPAIDTSKVNLDGNTVSAETVEYKKATEEDTAYSATAPTAVGNYIARYTLTVDSSDYAVFTATDTFTVSYLPAPENAGSTTAYILAGDKGENGWYITDVTVSAPAGYAISTSADGTGATDSLTVTASQAETNIYFVSILESADTYGGITDAISLEALSIDKTKPAITGAADKGAYSGASITVTVTDDNLSKVTLNEKEQTFSGTTCSITVPAATEAYTLVATDAAGLTETITFTVKKKTASGTVTMDDIYMGQMLGTPAVTFTGLDDGVEYGIQEEKTVYKLSTAATYGEEAPGTPGTYNVQVTVGFSDEDYEDFVGEATFTISFLPSPNPGYTLDGTEGENGWYTSDVTVKAPDGYAISRSEDGKEALSNLSITASQIADIIYLVSTKDDTTAGAVTDKIDLEAINIDKAAPEISNAEDGGVYYGDVTVTVTDDNLSVVTLNGTAQTITGGNKCEITVTANMNTTQTIIAKDKAGHSKIINITVNPSWMRDGITGSGTYHLYPATLYKLGSGSWTVEGDESSYGAISFYVETEGDYTFTLN